MTLPDKYFGEQNLELSRMLLNKQGEINSLRTMVTDHNALLIAAETRALRAEATLARVRQANDDMRTWCSPYGFVKRCAEHIDKAFAEPVQQGGTDG